MSSVPLPLHERIILIGEAPGPNTDPAMPLFPMPARSAGYYLYKLTGLPSRGHYLNTFHRMNLLLRHPGQWDGGKGGREKDRWPVREARIAAEAITPLLTGRRVVLVGRRVGEAFGLGTDELPFFEPRQWRPAPALLLRCFTTVHVIPHPSGRNHWYNVEGNRELARRFFRDLLSDAQDNDEESDCQRHGEPPSAICTEPVLAETETCS